MMEGMATIFLPEEASVHKEVFHPKEKDLPDFAAIFAGLLVPQEFGSEQSVEDSLSVQEGFSPWGEVPIGGDNVLNLRSEANFQLAKKALMEKGQNKPGMGMAESSEKNIALQMNNGVGFESNIRGEYNPDPLLANKIAFPEKRELIIENSSFPETFPVLDEALSNQSKNSPMHKMFSILDGDWFDQNEGAVLRNEITGSDLAEIELGKGGNNVQEAGKTKEIAGEAVECLQENTAEIAAENLGQFFTVSAGEKREIVPREINLNVAHLARDLPEIVLAELKMIKQFNAGKDIVVHLEPRELGKLVVKLNVDDGLVSIKLVAHYPVTRNLLESGLDSLRQSLTEQGISYASLDVELGGGPLEQNQYEQEQWWWSADKKEQEKTGHWGQDYETELSVGAGPRGWSPLSTYDYLV